MRTRIGAMLLLLIVSPPVWAGSDVVGIPSEAIIQSIEVDLKAGINVARQTHSAQARKPRPYNYHWISPNRKKSVLDNGHDYILKPHNLSISRYHMGYDSFCWDKSSRYLICNRIEEGTLKTSYSILDTNDPKGVWGKDIIVLKEIRYSGFLVMNTVSEELLFKVYEKDHSAGQHALISVSMRTLKRRVLYRSDEKIQFASVAPDGKTIVFGTEKGVYLCQKSKPIKVFLPIPGFYLFNLEWSPNSTRLLLCLRGGFMSKKYGVLGSIVLFNLNEKKPTRFLEKLTGRGRYHSLWFSKDGKRFGFAKESGLWIRKSDQIGKAAKQLIPVTPTMPIKGFTFNPKGSKIAVTAGSELWIYDLKTNRSRIQFRLGNAMTNFLARPHWSGDKITVSHINDSEHP